MNPLSFRAGPVRLVSFSLLLLVLAVLQTSCSSDAPPRHHFMVSVMPGLNLQGEGGTVEWQWPSTLGGWIGITLAFAAFAAVFSGLAGAFLVTLGWLLAWGLSQSARNEGSPEDRRTKRIAMALGGAASVVIGVMAAANMTVRFLA